jgi:hypothetical protein
MLWWECRLNPGATTEMVILRNALTLGSGSGEGKVLAAGAGKAQVPRGRELFGGGGQ